MDASQRLDELLAPELEALKQKSLYRLRRLIEGPQGPELTADGRPLLNFSSNDYLGLAADPRLAEAAKRGLDRYGTGSGAAHLVTGHSTAHHALEEELAAFCGRPRALLFSSGYMANLGIACALVGRGDRVFEDRLNHASMLDAGLLSGAAFSRYAHGNAVSLEREMEDGKGRTLALTDGVFSMDGDVAPLPALAKAADRHGAHLAVDDAHGFGVIGAGGRGSLEYHGVGPAEVPIYMATLGKACGCFGAFVAGSEVLVESLIQGARTYIYTTAAPAALAEASRAALKLVETETWRRDHLNALIARFRGGASQLGLKLMESTTPIQPLVVGEPDRALELSTRLKEQGLLVAAIRPPTVPTGTARLRITLTATHTEAQVDRLLEALKAANT
ncbi:MAG TPA: 8-amino-7-oxononanoate synthase [Gammaproteobacteria bacterium]|jgi:8-amino-7-oxononanoate synthase|nr:8-amino-7-oxononanoate synthase [Gammaproteobacteria bacterium]